MLIEGPRSVLMVVDVQERLCPVMDDPRRVLVNGAILVRAARATDVPVLVTEQYPKGIGPTMVDVRDLVPADAIIEKTAFAATGEPAVTARLAALGRPQVVVCGIEAHVCVLQTCLGLKAAGHEVAMVADACSSRRPANAVAAEKRLAAAGVAVMTTEMALFEWLGDATHPAFKQVHGLIR